MSSIIYLCDGIRRLPQQDSIVMYLNIVHDPNLFVSSSVEVLHESFTESLDSLWMICGEKQRCNKLFTCHHCSKQGCERYLFCTRWIQNYSVIQCQGLFCFWFAANVESRERVDSADTERSICFHSIQPGFTERNCCCYYYCWFSVNHQPTN